VSSLQIYIPQESDVSSSRPPRDSDLSALPDATLRHGSDPSFRSARRHDEREGGRSAARPNQKNPSGKSASFNLTEGTILYNDLTETPAARIGRHSYISLSRNDAALGAARSGEEESASPERGDEWSLLDGEGRSFAARVARL
jgi:hypothetical protein